MGELTAGLAGLGLPSPSEKALRDLRRRLGPAPLKALSGVVAGPLAQPHTPGVRFGGLRTVAFDGCNSVKIPDTERNRSWIGRIRYRMSWAGYPTLRLMALAETGTRALLGATVGSVTDRDETALATGLLPLLGPGMLVLLDRGFGATWFFKDIARTGAMLLCRACSSRNPQVREHLPDGSYLSCLEGLNVRIIEARVTAAGADGTRVTGSYRLITTLTGHRAFPATALVRLCHERGEIEAAFLALRHTLLNGRVLRSGDRPGIEQELWALLTLCQLLRMAMAGAAGTRPGTNPDRASFTTALEAARDQVTAAQGICPSSPAGLPGVIGRAVLATLLPARRPRYSARKIKAPTSRYQARHDPRPHASTAITAIGITIYTPALDPRPRSRIPAPGVRLAPVPLNRSPRSRRRPPAPSRPRELALRSAARRRAHPCRRAGTAAIAAATRPSSTARTRPWKGTQRKAVTTTHSPINPP